MHTNIKKCKKAESLIGDDKEVERRKQLATVALNKANSIWIKCNKVGTSKKIK